VVAAPAATNPAIIKALAADAYIWGLAPEFIWRFAQYNTIIGALTYGMVKPVSQLGSTQLVANQLALNTDGSLTLWFGPTLPTGAPASNWVPTPSTAYYSKLYSRPISTTFQLSLRMYYPTPGNEPPSILPYTGPPPLAESYIPPMVEMVQ
jgi:hypothetical protein